MVVINQETIDMVTQLAALAIPILAFILRTIKNKLSDNQGDTAFTQMKYWASQIKKLSIVFPEIEPLADRLVSLTDKAALLWDNPEDNSRELLEVWNEANEVYKEVMKLIEAHMKKKVNTTSGVEV